MVKYKVLASCGISIGNKRVEVTEIFEAHPSASIMVGYAWNGPVPMTKIADACKAGYLEIIESAGTKETSAKEASK